MTSKVKLTNEEKSKYRAIHKTWSKTLMVVIWWTVLLPVVVALQYCFNTEEDLVMFVYYAAGMTLAYMGYEYASDFIKNRSLPSGLGSIENINRYQTFIWIWNAYAAAAIVAHFVLGMATVPWIEIVMAAGALSLAYVSGNKVNKIATTM